MSWLFSNGIRKSVLSARLAKLKNIVAPELLAEFMRFCISHTSEKVSLTAAEEKMSIPKRMLIPLFLQAVKANVFVLEFSVICQSCKNQTPVSMLSGVHSDMVCAACSTHNHPELDSSVSAVFSLHPAIYKSQKTSSNDFLSAIEVVNTQEFRDFFESEKPLPGEFIRVKKMCFLFTDIAGSTATYERLGDDNAFRLVREHFNILFSTIHQHQGVCIKTMGDAVLASFFSPEEGIACARDLQSRFFVFNQRNDVQGSCKVKFGLHTGKCVIVTLNQRLDFFGSTVNTAARIQALARPGQLCITEKTAKNNKALFRGASVKKSVVRLKGISRPVHVLLVE